MRLQQELEDIFDENIRRLSIAAFMEVIDYLTSLFIEEICISQNLVEEDIKSNFDKVKDRIKERFLEEFI